MPKQIPERVGQVWTFTLVLDGVPELLLVSRRQLATVREMLARA